jgi:hypothetical protein
MQRPARARNNPFATSRRGGRGTRCATETGIVTISAGAAFMIHFRALADVEAQGGSVSPDAHFTPVRFEVIL